MKLSLLLWAVALGSAPVYVLGRAVPNSRCLEQDSFCSELLPANEHVYTHVSNLDHPKTLERRAFGLGRPRTPSPGPSLNRGGSGSGDRSGGGQPSLNNPGGSSGSGSLNNPGGGSSPGSLNNPDGVSSPGSLTNPGGTPDTPDRNPTPDIPSGQPSGSNANQDAGPPPDTIESDLLDGKVSFLLAKEKDAYERNRDENVAVALRSGQKAQFDLDLAISSRVADKHSDVTWEKVLQRYTTKGTPETSDGSINMEGKEALSNELQGLAATIRAVPDTPGSILEPRFTSYEWRNDPDNEGNIVQSGLYSPESKAIVEHTAFGDHDKLTKEDGRLHVSELRWQSWVKSSTDQGKDPKDLEFFIINNITGKNGEDVAERIFERHSVRWEDSKTIEITPDDGDLWFAMLGTDNLKGLLYMMGDHHHQLGNKKPTKVYLERAIVPRFGDDDPDGPEMDTVTNMAMVMG